MKRRISFVLVGLLGLNVTGFSQNTKIDKVDPSTLKGKFMCGYQGWFNTPNDGAGLGWKHYSRFKDKIDASTLVVDMWPDVSDYSDGDRVAVPGFKHADGSQAYVVSSHNPKVIDKHFEWMKEYEIDGAWYQHFLVSFEGGKDGSGYKSRRQILRWVKEAAQNHGRVWAVCFDTAGIPSSDIPVQVINEWKRLVDENITVGDDYLCENGLPVVHVWGLFHNAANNHLEPSDTKKLIDFFNTAGKYNATLVMGGSWNWKQIADPEWRNMYSKFKYFTPWNVNNVSGRPDGSVGASTAFWAGDVKQAKEEGIYWIPVVYPGFSWDNLRQKPPGTTNRPRKKGDFLWEQFYEADKLGIDTFYIAMFDEIDEGTAVFKICPTPPVTGHFVGTEGMPSDWYLRLIREARRIIKSGGAFPREIPINP